MDDEFVASTAHAVLGVESPAGPVDLGCMQVPLLLDAFESRPPNPVSPVGEWYAVPTADQPALLDACGLTDPTPATYDAAQTLGRSAQAYVSPVVDGWTFVFGELRSTPEESRDLCTALSLRFGTALWFGRVESGGCGDSGWWCLAENGTLVRYNYQDEDGRDAERGAPHEAEIVDDDDDDLDWWDVVSLIAARTTVDLEDLGPHTTVDGHGAFVSTARG
ncbi:hypothetical protein [Actinocatenispora rupis]|uniref:Uncharacterized protein n=1 Tax=Actinocatenispora rupis TaxID=519421 RepID=A0A8J3JAH6_9ACTN|nr:hypothetical protein [Actinocatenispora rupis]GID12433.1 hypothetical protein Aru02nite_33220 [Actinocatenispora rupis]